jgi:hypothetical protein
MLIIAYVILWLFGKADFCQFAYSSICVVYIYLHVRLGH